MRGTRWLMGGTAAAILATVGSAHADGRGAVKPADHPAQSVQRAASPARLSHHAVGFDGRDGEGLWLTHATIGYDLDAGPLLATRPAYPANTADDAARPGFGGVAWSSRPVVGGASEWNAYPYATDASAYGAYGAEDAVALVRVGPYVVPVDPWTPVSQEGPRETREVRERLERGRQEWLRERGFVGAVRTFVNDAAVMPRGDSRRSDRPVARFAGVSRTSDATLTKTDSDAAGNVGTAKDEAVKESEAPAMGEAPGASAVIRVNPLPVTRISMPHVAGLRNAGTRVITAAPVEKAEPKPGNEADPSSED